MRVRNHITVEVIIDYVENRLDADEVARVRNHLNSGCPLCTEEVAFWQRTLPRLTSEHTVAAPQWVIQRAFNLFNSVDRKPNLLERILATVIFDSRQQLLAAGVRDLHHTSFRLLFEATDIRIDLLCERENDLWSVAGQVLADGAPEQEWKVALQGEHTERYVSADVFGEFQLQHIPPGQYEFVLRDGEREIALPPLDL